jgi:hypothetical protein
MSRKAKQLVNKRNGREASYGLVLEELLHSRGQTFEFPPPSTVTSKFQPNEHFAQTNNNKTGNNSNSNNNGDEQELLRSPKAKASKELGNSGGSGGGNDQRKDSLR